MSKNEIIYDNIIAFHPGSFVEDIIEDLNITQREFAKRLGTSPKNLSELINGEISLSPDIAYKLEKITGTSMNTWMNLQCKYDKKIIEIERLKIDEEKEVCNCIDFKYFKIHNFVEDRVYQIKEKLEFLRNELNISNLCLLKEFNTTVSYRNTQGEFTEKNIINSNVMLEIAANIAKDKCDKKLDTAQLKKYIPEIKSMTLKDPDVFFPRLTEILLECGIVLVALPNLKNANLNGATKKFRNGSVLLLITDRNKDSDIFWFSLLHELGHVLKRDFNSNIEDTELYVSQEKSADKFAQETLLNENRFREYIKKNQITKRTICEFANQEGVNPGIVVGRLQNEKLIKYSEYNNLKSKYNIIVNNK